MNRRALLTLFLLGILLVFVGSASAQNSYSLWFGSFWDNKDMAGNPVAKASTGEINFDWGTGFPEPGVPADNWSAKWTSIVDFSPGTYRITVQNDDGVAIYLGDKHVIYDWNAHPLVTNQVEVSLLGGDYPMAVSYFEEIGGAVLKLSWERIGPPKSGAADVTVVGIPTTIPSQQPAQPQASWQAVYWNNTTLTGTPALTRTEASVNYDWGKSSPAPGTIAADNFSVRWSRSVYFPSGSYRFTTHSDDGIRVYIDDRRIIDHWDVHAVETDTADVDLQAGTYTVTIEYFEADGEAVAKLGWDPGNGTSVTETGVTATVMSYALNVRSGPGISYHIVKQMPRYMAVPVVGRTASGPWIQIVYQGVTGWSHSGYMKISGDLNSVPVTW